MNCTDLKYTVNPTPYRGQSMVVTPGVARGRSQSVPSKERLRSRPATLPTPAPRPRGPPGAPPSAPRPLCPTCSGVTRSPLRSVPRPGVHLPPQVHLAFADEHPGDSPLSCADESSPWEHANTRLIADTWPLFWDKFLWVSARLLGRKVDPFQRVRETVRRLPKAAVRATSPPATDASPSAPGSPRGAAVRPPPRPRGGRRVGRRARPSASPSRLTVPSTSIFHALIGIRLGRH